MAPAGFYGSFRGTMGITKIGRRSAKIICSLGPSTDDERTLAQLLENGMDAARLNFAFEAPEVHVERLKRLRALPSEQEHPIAVIADLSGRKIRLGQVEGLPTIEAGDTVRFVPDEGQLGGPEALPVDASFFHPNMAPGDTILMSDGTVELRITEHSEKAAKAEVIFGGSLRSEISVHVPGMTLTGSVLTEADQRSLAVAVEHKVDYIAVSHIIDPSDILTVRERLYELGAEIPIIAKIERSEAFARLDGILARADGLMIRRGDLGAQIELTRVPLVQKRILQKATTRGIPAIISTQMLGSMVSSPVPTRAEASDVSNSIRDGADGLMLSPETAVGAYPVEALSMMDRIIVETEKEMRRDDYQAHEADPDTRFSDVAAYMGCLAAKEMDGQVIACATESGYTARLVAKYRPHVPIVAFSPHEDIRRRLALYWGMNSEHIHASPEPEDMVRDVETRLLEHGAVKPGDHMVLVYGSPAHVRGQTNTVRLHRVREP